MKFRQWLTRVMAGRNGVDALCKFLMIPGYALWLVGLMVGELVGSVLLGLGFACVIISLWRSLSRSTVKRAAENRWYLGKKAKVVGWLRVRKNRFAQRKTHRFIKCPQCGTVGRIPRGRGSVNITCTKCRAQFKARS